MEFEFLVVKENIDEKKWMHCIASITRNHGSRRKRYLVNTSLSKNIVRLLDYYVSPFALSRSQIVHSYGNLHNHSQSCSHHYTPCTPNDIELSVYKVQYWSWISKCMKLKLLYRLQTNILVAIFGRIGYLIKRHVIYINRRRVFNCIKWKKNCIIIIISSLCN